MRRLAEATERHPSTVMRAIRRVEARRDDPLIDSVLERLERRAGTADSESQPWEEIALYNDAAKTLEEREAEIAREAKRILRRLSEPQAFMALASGAEVGCVFRKADAGLVTLAKIAVGVVREFAAREWIRCLSAGPSMARYEITAVGRSALRRLLAEDAEARRKPTGFAERPSPFSRQHQADGEREITEEGVRRKIQVNLGETPIGWLAKRKGSDGAAFLSDDEVAAGEKLREDFELAQIGPKVAQDWRRFLTPATQPGVTRLSGPAEGPMGARNRVSAALEALGPGLNDAAMRACCFLEGLEATERRMGWSARSGKVVLKIALGRLAEHYGFRLKSGEQRRAG